MCEEDKNTASGYKQNSDGTVVFKPLDNNGQSISLAEFLELHKNDNWRSEMGGHQGSDGQMKLLVF